jgi:hypothetical protein
MTFNETGLYLWLTEALLPRLKPRGIYAAPDPAPLTTAEVRAIFERVAEHKSYKGQVLVMATLDEEVIDMQRGEINVKPVAGTPWEGKPQVFPREEPGG